MKFNTYGACLQSLKVALKCGMEKASPFFGTPTFLDNRSISVHRAFDNWCSENDVEPSERGAFRETLRKHIAMYPQFDTTSLRVLLRELPHEFNVRGHWTSEHV